jgi:ubiquinone/menaquinone biosynthesis C-methylase UbiE
MISINKKNYWVSIKFLDNILKIILHIYREKIYKIFSNNIPLKKNYKLIDIGTSPMLEKSENIILSKYKWKENITCLSDQNCNILKKKYKKTKFLVGDAKKINYSNNTFDIVYSSATIEHLGSYENQLQALKEMYRISKKYLFLTTPNRFFPIEMHTKLPFLHFFPKKVFRLILRFFGENFFCYEKNLNLLTKKDLVRLCTDAKIINYKIIYNYLLFLKSNMILIVEKK